MEEQDGRAGGVPRRDVRLVVSTDSFLNMMTYLKQYLKCKSVGLVVRMGGGCVV